MPHEQVVCSVVHRNGRLLQFSVDHGPSSFSAVPNTLIAAGLSGGAIALGLVLITFPGFFPPRFTKLLAAVIVIPTLGVFAALMVLPDIFPSDKNKLAAAGGIAVFVFGFSIWIAIPQFFPSGIDRSVAAWAVAVAVFVFGAFGVLSRPGGEMEFRLLLGVWRNKALLPSQVHSNAVWVAQTTRDPDLTAAAEYWARNPATSPVWIWGVLMTGAWWNGGGKPRPGRVWGRVRARGRKRVNTVERVLAPTPTA
jgi:hypothetical protein